MTVYILLFIFHVIIYGSRVCNKHLIKQTNCVCLGCGFSITNFFTQFNFVISNRTVTMYECNPWCFIVFLTIERQVQVRQHSPSNSLSPPPPTPQNSVIFWFSSC